MIVRLSPQWIAQAINVGLKRRQYAEARGLEYTGLHYTDGSKREINPPIDDCLGALAECAVAKVLRLPWDPSIGAIDNVDVGGMAEVRMRRVPGTGTDLIIRPKDHDDLPYVLVHVSGVEWTTDVVGWLYGREGKSRGVWFERNGIWFVPPPYRPIEDLIELCEAA